MGETIDSVLVGIILGFAVCLLLIAFVSTCDRWKDILRRRRYFKPPKDDR